MAKQRGTKRNADSVEVEDTGDSEKHVIAKQRGTKRKKHPVEIEGTEDLPTTKRQRSQSPPARRKAPRARKHDGDSSEVLNGPCCTFFSDSLTRTMMILLIGNLFSRRKT